VSSAHDTSGRILADAVRDLPGGLRAVATEPAHVGALTALLRAVDLAGAGHTSSNLEETYDELDAPDCRWGHGSVTVWRGDDLVAGLVVWDGLASGRGWMFDVYCRPGDPKVNGINGALIDAAVREGRARFDMVFPDPDEPMQEAKSGAYANDGALRAELEERGFAEVRRYWRMKVDHVTMADALAPDPLASAQSAGRDPVASVEVPEGYVLRRFRDEESEWRAFHAAHTAAFMDHFDFTPLDFETWREQQKGATADVTQWLVVEKDGEIVGHATGSNRLASEDYGYVDCLGVTREHRGRGVARALLRARMADDIARGFISTVLHVDSTNPTGATHLYESVGMKADVEFVGFHRPLYG
jgi:mycothiol synthase